MDLSYTPEQEAFRAEVREWLAEHVPAKPLASLIPRQAAAHREWERTLAAGNWGMVTWPEAFGGRGAISFNGSSSKYYRAGARAGQSEWHLPAGPLMEYGSRAESAVSGHGFG